jgi:hypothetical protein
MKLFVLFSLLLVAGSATASRFHNVCFRGSLFYNSMLQGDVHVGDLNGTVAVQDDLSRIWLEVDGRPFDVKKFGAHFKGQNKWGVSLEVSKQEFFEMLSFANKNVNFRYRVEDLLRRIERNSTNRSYFFGGKVCQVCKPFELGYAGKCAPVADDCRTELSSVFQAHDGHSPEALHFKIEFCRNYTTY